MKTKRLVHTLELNPVWGDYQAGPLNLAICVSGLRKKVYLPAPSPDTIDLVFTKRRMAQSFALTVGRRCGETKPCVRDYRGGTYYWFDRAIKNAYEQGFRYVRVEYDA